MNLNPTPTIFLLTIFYVSQIGVAYFMAKESSLLITNGWNELNSPNIVTYPNTLILAFHPLIPGPWDQPNFDWLLKSSPRELQLKKFKGDSRHFYEHICEESYLFRFSSDWSIPWSGLHGMA